MWARWFGQLIVGLIVVALLRALYIQNFQDDAFISFRYAQHIGQGLGSVWNAGDAPSFGYTNLLWTLMLSLNFGFEHSSVADFYSIIFLGINLALGVRLIPHFFKAQLQILLVYAAWATNYTLVAFGTSGLETAMHGCLWTAMVLLALERPYVPRQPKELLQFTGLATLLLLSRPDGLLLLVPTMAFLVLSDRKRGLPVWSSVQYAIVPCLVAVAVYLGLAYGVTRSFLPIPFFAKTGSAHVGDGLLYLGVFAAFTGLVFPLLVALARMRRFLQGISSSMLYLVAVVLIWGAYMLEIGGDFMEFRMMLPLLPALYILAGWTAFSVLKKPLWGLALMGFLILANVLQGPLLGRVVYTGWIQAVERPVGADAKPAMSFRAQGEAWKDLFGREKGFVLALGNAGATPYHAGLQCVDIFGLTDLDIARNGLEADISPGHRRIARISQLLARRANLLQLRCDHRAHVPTPAQVRAQDQVWQVMEAAEPQFSDFEFIQIPLDADFVASCVYLRPHPRVDALRLHP